VIDSCAALACRARVAAILIAPFRDNETLLAKQLATITPFPAGA